MENFARTEEMFLAFNKSLEQEADTREEIKKVVKEIDQTCRQIIAILQQLHSKMDQVNELCKKSKEMLEPVRNHFTKIQSIITPELYFKYHDHWRFVITQIVFICALMRWLENGTLISIQEIESLIGVPGKSNRDPSFCVEL